jgi:hypothetical protein
MRTIYLTNLSTKVTNEDVYAMSVACNFQSLHHACPALGITPVYVRYLKRGEASPARSIVIGVLDNADQAGDLGWHTEGANGVQYGRVFAEPVIMAGGNALTDVLSVCSVASHEVLETLCDPACNRWADDESGVSYALEIADPVESSSYQVTIPAEQIGATAGILATVSDFVLPAWFDPQATTGPFDFLALLNAPFEVRSDGYVTTMTDGTVSQTFGEHYPEWRKRMKETPTARTARRNEQSRVTIEGALHKLHERFTHR